MTTQHTSIFHHQNQNHSNNHNQNHSQTLKSYYKQIHDNLLSLAELHSCSTPVRNKIQSYLITLLKGNQNLRQLPKQINNRAITRQLRFLAIDRTYSESMGQISAIEKDVMNQYANKINQERERDGNFGDALRDLVRLARLNNIAREHSDRAQL